MANSFSYNYYTTPQSFHTGRTMAFYTDKYIFHGKQYHYRTQPTQNTSELISRVVKLKNSGKDRNNNMMTT